MENWKEISSPPEKSGNYLVWLVKYRYGSSNDFIEHPYILWFSQGRFDAGEFEGSAFSKIEVTHWMEQPSKPK